MDRDFAGDRGVCVRAPEPHRGGPVLPVRMTECVARAVGAVVG